MNYDAHRHLPLFSAGSLISCINLKRMKFSTKNIHFIVIEFPEIELINPKMLQFYYARIHSMNNVLALYETSLHILYLILPLDISTPLKIATLERYFFTIAWHESFSVDYLLPHLIPNSTNCFH